MTDFCTPVYLADPATFLASKSVPGFPLLSSENSLFIHLQERYIFLRLYYYLINIVDIKILSFVSTELRSASLIGLIGSKVSDTLRMIHRFQPNKTKQEN